MKKLRLIIISLTLLLPVYSVADEGMWLLQLIEKMNIKDMKAAGLKLSAKDIYDINHASIKDAIVQFGGGCTAEVVSSKGLLFTNHHCGYSSIQRLSSVEHDYLKDGYWAMNTSQELPCQGLSVTFVDKFIDVTQQMLEVEKATEKMSAADAAKYRRNIEDSLVNKAIGNDKYLRGRIFPLYQGNVYYLVTTKTFRDIRFVGAPPSSIGKFGGETDNWEWPRHTGDFSVFRIYADKDNNPAPYSPDNVPYTPKKHLSISLKGYKPGDFAMIIGFPGRTQRYLTSQEVVERRDAQNEPMIISRTAKENVWRKAMRADQKTNIQYASKFASSSNYRKNSIGMNTAFAKLDIVNRKAAEEREFNAWASANSERKAKYGDAIDKINGTIAKRKDAYRAMYYLIETLNNVEIISPASVAARFFGKDSAEIKFKEATAGFYKDYDPKVDREASKALLKTFKEQVTNPKYIPQCYKNIDEKFGGNIDAYVDNIFDNSVFTDQEKAAKAISDSIFDLRQDPAIDYLSTFSTTYSALAQDRSVDAQLFNEGKKAYMAGLLEKKASSPIYPDANSTMRITYGKVGGYTPKDGVEYKYYTTLDGVMQKEDASNPEFEVPARLKELWKKKDYGQYALKNGELPVCFLTNNDITGGNSGSDVLNANGELIGLAFDGNWEAMSGDILFETELQRCINVDIRYVLFIIDKYGGAGYLLKEMTIVK